MPQRPIPWAQPEFWGDEKEFVLEALSSSWISGGPFVERLEAECAARLGVKHAIAVSNGTTAIHLAYLALGLSSGDEVVVPGFCFLAAANIALHMGLRPVFAEVDSRTWCLDAAAVVRCLSPRTRAIIPVHTYGNVCAMDELLEVARSHGVAVIEDAAESFLSRYRGRESGTMGTMGCFSFQATKTITTGEGGMVVTNDPALHERMQLYRSHGVSRRRYWHLVPGHNFRLTNLQAALGCAQMRHLPRIAAERIRVHGEYQHRLEGRPGLTLQHFDDCVDPVLWCMAVQLDPGVYPQGRDRVMEQMEAAGVETRPGFYPPSSMKFYECPPVAISEAVGRQVISLPTFPTLTSEQIERISSSLTALASVSA